MLAMKWTTLLKKSTIKRKLLCLWAALLLALLAGCTPDEPRPQDDFYEAINHKTLTGWEIPANQTNISYFTINNEENFQKITAEVKAAADNLAALSPGSDEWNVAAFYLTGMDQQKRNNSGFGQVGGAFLAEVDQAESVSELLHVLLRFSHDYSICYLGSLSYEVDFADASQKILTLGNPDFGLQKEIWLAEDPESQNMVAAYTDMLEQLWVQAGNPESSAQETVAQVTAMLRDLAQAALSHQDSYDPKQIYNPYSLDRLPDYVFSGQISGREIAEMYGVPANKEINILEPALTRRLANWLTEDNLPLLKNYVRLLFYSDTAAYREIAALDIHQEYRSRIYGLEPQEVERRVIVATDELLNFQCGKLYCDKYLSKEAKQDVEAMIREIAAAYAKRLDNQDWLNDATRSAAKHKLAMLSYAVGCPDDWPQSHYRLELSTPEQGGLYLDNYFAVNRAMTDYMLARKDEPVQRDEWLMAPQETNAYYNPSSNSITIMAGILQEPFYSPDASQEENLGGVGMIIAHELTHAFDNTGAQYDEQGAVRNWWTEEDLQRFAALADRVVVYYDGMEVEGLAVDGSLTVGENIADLGAVACITQIAQDKGLDLEALYKAYAQVWAEQIRPEYLSYRLTTNEHSPNKIRVNAVLSAIDQFYEVFHVQPGDGMYVPPEQRPSIW